MHHALLVKLPELVMPALCVVCGDTATRKYTLLRTFPLGSHSYSVNLPAPMCNLHHALAVSKSLAERRCEQVGMGLGVLMGALAASALGLLWSQSPSGLTAMHLALLVIVAVGIGLSVWLGVLLSVSPRFAAQEALAAREALTLYHYWPTEQVLELRFVHAEAAEKITRALMISGNVVSG